MDLATHQRGLLALLRFGQSSEVDDPYIRSVERSRDLEEARRNIFLWRVYVLERTARLTFTLLKHRHLLKDTLCEFMARENISPFRETQAPAFLDYVSAHRDSVIRAVAQFELALQRVKQGDPTRYVIDWDVEPSSILASLARDAPYEGPPVTGRFAVVVSRDLPHGFCIVPV